MWPAEAFRWLVDQGLWHSLVGAVVITAVGWLLRVGKRLRKIESSLDTKTPGGLTEVVDELRRQSWHRGPE